MKELEFYESLCSNWPSESKKMLCNVLVDELMPLLPLTQPLLGRDMVEDLMAIEMTIEGPNPRCRFLLNEKVNGLMGKGDDPGGIASVLLDILASVWSSCKYVHSYSDELLADAAGGPRAASRTTIAIMLENEFHSEQAIQAIGAFVDKYELMLTASTFTELDLRETIRRWRPIISEVIHDLWYLYPDMRVNGGFRLLTTGLGHPE